MLKEKLTHPYYQEFRPDLIVEVTSVCDRACPGCYAPNLISKRKGEDLLRLNPKLFLSAPALSLALSQMSRLDMMTFRGGEPSKHPALDELLRIARQYCSSIFLETHGRWILNEDGADLLSVCRDLGIILKVSFDKMHGLSREDLRAISTKLSKLGIRHCVAITESTFEEFLKMRGECQWLEDHEVIYQKKASQLKELVRPKIGVLKVDGTLMGNLTAKASFGS